MTQLRVVIPARLLSSRLPRKPLVDLDGKPMIVRTYTRCLGVFEPEQIIVATDSDEIARVCQANGIVVQMTSADHLTGTDRVAEVATKVPADVYINVQGDEPVFDQGDLAKIREFALSNPTMLANGYCPIHDAEEHRSPFTPKVVVDVSGKLLYMSRAPIPGNKLHEFRFGYRQVCAYAFPADALRVFREHPAKTPLEAQEDIEILRFVELGHPVQMLPMSDRSVPVDHPADVQKVLQVIRAMEHS